MSQIRKVFKEIKDIFGKPIESVEDYTNRIQKIQNAFERNNCSLGGNIFYRGDKLSTEVCAKRLSERLLEESEDFQSLQKNCNYNCDDCGKKKGGFDCLSRMQHEGKITRLLDFSINPLVALRFACGKENEEAVDRKITIFITKDRYIDSKLERKKNIVTTMMKLVNSENIDDMTVKEKRIIADDYFVKAPFDFEKITRQKGMFLFMGNRESLDSKKSPCYKVKHTLNSKTGRGETYGGYVDVFTISKENVKSILKELETKEEYKDYRMDYLLCKDNKKGQ